MNSRAMLIFAALPLLIFGQETLEDAQLLERLQEIQARAEKLHQEGEEAFGQFCHGPSAVARAMLGAEMLSLEGKAGEGADAMLNKAKLVRTRLQRINAARESEPAKKIDKLVVEYNALKQQVDQEYGRHLLDRYQLIESVDLLSDAEDKAEKRLAQLQKRYSLVTIPGTTMGKLKYQAVQDLIEEALDSLRALRREKSSLVHAAFRMARGHKAIDRVRQTLEQGMRTVRVLDAQHTDLLLWQYCMKLGSPQIIAGAARGKVSAESRNEESPISVGSICEPGSKISTGKGGYCWLYLPFNRLIEMGPESEVALPTKEEPQANLERGCARILGVMEFKLPRMKNSMTSVGDVILKVDDGQSRVELAKFSQLSGEAASWFKEADTPTSWIVNGGQPKSMPSSTAQLAASRRQLRGMPYELSQESRPSAPEQPLVNLSKSDAPSDSDKTKTEKGKDAPAKSDVAPSFAPE